MANISSIIENFILDALKEDSSIEISRNALAEYFNCAPSQINYVLETRFTIDRGFSIESRRGGGGYIKISKLSDDNEQVTSLIFNSIGEELSFRRMSQILDRLCSDKIINKKEKQLLKIVLSDESLSMPIILTQKVRANAFKNVLIKLAGGDK